MTHFNPDLHLLSALSAGQPLRPIVVQTRLEQQGQPVSDAAVRLSRLARRGLAQRHPRYGYTLTPEGEAHLHRHWPPGGPRVHHPGRPAGA